MVINISKNIYEKLFHQLAPVISWTRESPPYQWFMEHKEHVAASLYIFWMAGCSFWVYKTVTTSVSAHTNVTLVTATPREALVYLFFGTFGLIFASLFACYILKFIYNLFHGGIHSLFSHQLHLLAKPVSYLILLYFAFVYTGPIKESGMKMYSHVAQLVHIAKQKEIAVKDRSAGILELLDQKTRH